MMRKRTRDIGLPGTSQGVPLPALGWFHPALPTLATVEFLLVSCVNVIMTESLTGKFDTQTVGH
jgi:hypothetical protein